MRDIIKTIKDAADKAIPKTDGFFKTCPVPWWNSKCAQIKNERKRLERRMKNNKTAYNTMEYKRVRGLTKKTFVEEKKKSWNFHKKSINLKKDIRQAYKKINKIRGKFTPTPTPSLREGTNNSLTTDPQEVAEIFAKHFAEILIKTVNENKREYKQSKEELEKMEKALERKKVDSERHQDNQYLNSTFSKADLQLAISESKDSAPGMDMITNLMISHLTEEQQDVLLKGINKLFIEKTYLEEWGVEIKLPFHKQGKDPKNSSSYRGISLTSCICKLMERMVSNRFTWFMEKNEKYNPAQSGFRKCKSTMDAICQLVTNVQKAMKEKKHLTAIFFDLEKAYDTTWRAEVIKPLLNMGIRDQTLAFFKNFLNNRRFVVRIGDSTSAEKEQKEGIPQGSVLSVICFALAINDITDKLPKEIKRSIYVDDLVIYATAKKGNLSDRLLQNCISLLEKWAKKKGVRFSKSKTVTLKFQRRSDKIDPELFLDGERIQTVKETKYLGMYMDSHLNWSKQIEYLRHSCISGINLLRITSGLEWSADRESLFSIYQALVLSKIDYGSQFYNSASEHLLKRVEVLQNECLRICSGAFKSSPIDSLQVETNTPPLKYRRDIISLKFLFKMESNPQSLTYETVMNDDGLENPMREYLKDLKTTYSINEPKIETQIFPPKPASSLPPIEVCNFLPLSKKITQPERLKMEWISHKNNHNSNYWYTDGSKTTEGVGFAAVSSNRTRGGGLTPNASVYTAELYAIKTAVDGIVEEGEEGAHTIFSDSQSALQILKSLKKPPMALTIQMKITEAANINKRITLC